MSEPYHCDCGAYVHGEDPHPGEVDLRCFSCWVAEGWADPFVTPGPVETADDVFTVADDSHQRFNSAWRGAAS